jgi:NAD(P)-dependent dehydrogenase (short-subunit alcohol dehydrogenase family)
MLQAVVQQGADAQDISTKAVREQYAERSATGRIGTPEEAAEAVLWLASHAAAYVHGGASCSVR